MKYFSNTDPLVKTIQISEISSVSLFKHFDGSTLTKRKAQFLKYRFGRSNREQKTLLGKRHSTSHVVHFTLAFLCLSSKMAIPGYHDK